MARPRTEHLTPTQERILAYIRQSIADRGEAPTLEEIGAEMGLGSRSAVHYQLEQMQRKGAITRQPHRSRGIRLA
jgi:repressor LexA